MDENPSTPAPIATPAASSPFALCDHVRYFAGKDSEPCGALVVAVNPDGTADLKVFPNPPNNPAHVRKDIIELSAVRFSKEPASDCFSPR